MVVTANIRRTGLVTSRIQVSSKQDLLLQYSADTEDTTRPARCTRARVRLDAPYLPRLPDSPDEYKTQPIIMASLAADADFARGLVVIDTGSDTCKIGMSGDEFPRAEFKTVVGRPRAHGVMVGMPIQDDFVGDEAYFKRGVLSLKCPLLDHGIVNDW